MHRLVSRGWRLGRSFCALPTVPDQSVDVVRERSAPKPELADEVVERLRQLPDDVRPTFLDSGRVNVRRRKLHLSEMEDENTTLSQEASRFRPVVYDEGELDGSDLTRPPSKSNPHPLDPASLPPTHSRSLAAYVNHLEVLQKLVEVGVDLFSVDLENKLGQALLRLDWKKDVLPKLRWLTQYLKVNPEQIGSYLTRNPYFLVQEPEQLQQRVDYLRGKKFKHAEIRKVVLEYRYWLNTDVAVIDGRLGWFQRQFQLPGKALRSLVVKEPRVIMFGVGPTTAVLNLLNGTLMFNPAEVKRMLLSDPRLFMMDPGALKLSHHYMTQVMGVKHSDLVRFPWALRCSVAMLRRRHEFLHRLGKAQYDEELPGYVSPRRLLEQDDALFARDVCEVPLKDYHTFLKTL